MIIGDESLLGPDPAAHELALTSLARIWKSCSTLQEHFASRRAKMEEDPNKVPEIPGDDHAEFREQFVLKHPETSAASQVRRADERVYLVHGSVPFYEVGEMRTRSEQVAQKSGLSKNAEDLLKVVTIDQPSFPNNRSWTSCVLFRSHSSILNICEFTYAAGPLRYLSELEEWRHENRGLALLLSVDSLIRKKIYRLNSDQHKTFSTFSAALLEVLNHHTQLWNDARSSAELDKFRQAGQSAPTTPPRRHPKRYRSETPPKAPSSAKARKALLKSVKSQAGARPKDPPKKDARVPAEEWAKITSF